MRRGCAELACIATYRPGLPWLRSEGVEEGLRGESDEGPRGFCPPPRRILHLFHLTRPASVRIRDDRIELISGDDILGLTS